MKELFTLTLTILSIPFSYSQFSDPLLAENKYNENGNKDGKWIYFYSKENTPLKKNIKNISIEEVVAYELIEFNNGLATGTVVRYGSDGVILKTGMAKPDSSQVSSRTKWPEINFIDTVVNYTKGVASSKYFIDSEGFSIPIKVYENGNLVAEQIQNGTILLYDSQGAVSKEYSSSKNFKEQRLEEIEKEKIEKEKIEKEKAEAAERAKKSTRKS